MKEISVMLNEDKYVVGYCDYGFNTDGYILKNIEEKYLDKYEMLKNGEILEQKYEVNEIFKQNMMYFKDENGILVLDEERKKKEEELVKQQEKEVIQNQIIDLEMRKRLYEERRWTTDEIDKQLLELENKLLTY